ncbi:MAK10-like protein [Tanacetum coccineum]
MQTERGDGVAGIKRCRRDLSGDGVRNLAMASGRGRLKEDLESSTWRRLQNFYDHVNPVIRRTIDQSDNGKLHDRNIEESWALLEDLALYDNESWNDLRDFAKPVKTISLPQDVPMVPTTLSTTWKIPNKPLLNMHPRVPTKREDLHLNLSVFEVLAHVSIYNAMLDKYVESLELGKNGSAFVQGEVSAKIEDPGLFTLPCRLGDSKPFDTLDDLGSYVEVHIGKLKLLNDFYVIDMKKDPETPLLVGRGFLATTNVVIDCRKAKIVVGEGITRKDFLDCHFLGEWEIARDAEINPLKDVLVFRRMVEFLEALPINLKRNMWESKDLIENPINWDKQPKDGDGAWHAKIRIIDSDGEEFTKTLQLIPTTRKLFERESPQKIINLDHFYDT